jgi:glycosyltransferase involved in cell wall biosynthesis
MRTLFICPFLPARNAPQAGHRLAFEYICTVAESSSVDVILLLKETMDPSNELYRLPNVEVVLVEKFNTIDLIFRSISNFGKITFLTRYSKKVARIIIELIRSNKYDMVNLEFSQTFIYIRDIRANLDEHVTIHLCAHDIQAQAYLRKSGIQSLFSSFVFKEERQLTSLANKIFVLSEKDKGLMKGLYGDQLNIELKPIPLPKFITEIDRTPNSIEKGSLMFWGAMNRAENELSIVNFIDHVYRPLCAEKGTEIRLYIVGANPTAKLKKYASENIIITGFVENPVSYFNRAEIGIVPLLYGAGVKLKTLEMLASGMHVISTPIGSEGIDVQAYDNISVCEMQDFGKNIMIVLGKSV